MRVLIDNGTGNVLTNQNAILTSKNNKTVSSSIVVFRAILINRFRSLFR